MLIVSYALLRAGNRVFIPPMPSWTMLSDRHKRLRDYQSHVPPFGADLAYESFRVCFCFKPTGPFGLYLFMFEIFVYFVG